MTQNAETAPTQTREEREAQMTASVKEVVAAREARMAKTATTATLCQTCTAPLPDGDRNTVCCRCHNAAVAVYRAQRKAWLAEQRERGRAYWATQGITPGDRVTRFAVSMFGLGGETVTGTAKIGAVGAYVTSKFQAGRLTRHGWKKAAS